MGERKSLDYYSTFVLFCKGENLFITKCDRKGRQEVATGSGDRKSRARTRRGAKGERLRDAAWPQGALREGLRAWRRASPSTEKAVLLGLTKFDPTYARKCTGYECEWKIIVNTESLTLL